MVGLGAFEMDALIRRRGGGVGGRRVCEGVEGEECEVRCATVRTVACAVAGCALVTSLITDLRGASVCVLGACWKRGSGAEKRCRENEGTWSAPGD